MTGQLVPIVVVPRFTSFTGVDQYFTLPVRVAERLDVAQQAINQAWRGDGENDRFAALGSATFWLGENAHQLDLFMRATGMLANDYPNYKPPGAPGGAGEGERYWEIGDYPDGTRPLGVMFETGPDPYGAILTDFAQGRLNAMRNNGASRRDVAGERTRLKPLLRHHPTFAAILEAEAVYDGVSGDERQHATKTIKLRMTQVARLGGAITIGETSSSVSRSLLIQLASKWGHKNTGRTLRNVESSVLPWHVFRGDSTQISTRDDSLGIDDTVARWGRGGVIRRLRKTQSPKGTQTTGRVPGRTSERRLR